MTRNRGRTIQLVALCVMACSDAGGPAAKPTGVVLEGTVPSSVLVGAPQTTLLLSGRGFTTASRGLWNGTERPTTYVSDRQLRMTLADSDVATARVGALTVETPTIAPAISNALEFTVANPRPALQSIFPDNIFAGAFPFGLTVNGANFVQASQVTLNGNSRKTFFLSPNAITINVLASDVAVAGKLTVSVTNPAPGGGTSESATFVINASPPRISALSPGNAAVGDTALEMVVLGENFTPAMSIQWNGAPRQTTYWSTIRLSTIVRAGDLTAAGTAEVKIVDPVLGQATAPLTFTIYQFPAGQVSRLSPPVGVVGSTGMTLTVEGSRFMPGMVVQLDGTPRPTTFVSPSTLTATIPAANLAIGRVWTLTVGNPTSGQLSNSTYFPIALKNPPGPTVPIPPQVWQPAVGATPTTGTFLYLQRDSGEFVGGGKTRLFTGPALMLPRNKLAAAGVSLDIGGWFVALATMPGLTEFVRGYYLNDYFTLGAAAVGELTVLGEGHGCTSPTNWFAIDDVSYVAGALTLLAGRFEEPCLGLRGAFRWVE